MEEKPKKKIVKKKVRLDALMPKTKTVRMAALAAKRNAKRKTDESLYQEMNARRDGYFFAEMASRCERLGNLLVLSGDFEGAKTAFVQAVEFQAKSIDEEQRTYLEFAKKKTDEV